MKKIFLVAAVAVSMFLSSCGGGSGVKCWEISYKWLGQKVPAGAIYGDASQADAYMKELESIIGFGTFSKKGTNKSETDCNALNVNY